MFLETLASNRWHTLQLLLTLAALWAPTWAQLAELEPATAPASGQEEILVQPHSQVRIECKLPHLEASNHRFYSWNFQKIANSNVKPHILCYESKCSNGPGFGIQLDMDKETRSYDLVINNVTYELNDGFYYCDYKDSAPETMQTINREFRLTVLIPPQPPSLAPVNAAPAREGQEFQLSCASQGGNPEPNISWFRNEQPLQANLNGVRIEQTRLNGLTNSTLSWLVSVDDHLASYKCQVWNKAMGPMQSYEREHRLRVEYAPRINVGQHNPLRVLQNASFSLTCQVDANPPVKAIRWLKNGELISNQFNHTISEARDSDAALYACQADNGIPPVSLHGQVVGPSASLMSLFGLSSEQSNRSPTAVEAQLPVQVLYGPRVEVRLSNSSTQLRIGDQLSLNCSVDAWPPAHEILWTRDDEPNFRRLAPASKPTLELGAVSALDVANYTCTAFNRLEPSGLAADAAPIERQGSGSARVLVRHPPGVAEIVAGRLGETELDAPTPIVCRARPPGYPEPKYRFWRHQGAGQVQLTKSGLPVYTIHRASAEDEANFSCQASNELGQSSVAFTELIVNEPPKIIDDANRRREDTRNLGEHAFKFTVRAYGKPEPKVSWFQRSPVDGKRVELSAAEQQARFRIETSTSSEQGSKGRLRFNVVSSLTFRQPLELDDRGLYSVEFTNGPNRLATEEFKLHLNHAPMAAPRHQQLARNSQQQLAGVITTKAGFNVGDTARLTCRVSAWPKPEFLWYANGPTDMDKPIESGGRYASSLSNPIDDIWESTLIIGQVSEADFGQYLCVSANQQPTRISDSLSILVNLAHKSPPDAPGQLEVVESNADSVSLQWLPGFDGGFPSNQFLVQFAPDDGRPLSRKQPEATGGSGQQDAADQSSRFFDCQAANPCTVGPLAARQAYLLRVWAKNELGLSEPSEEVRATTRANASQIPRISDASYDLDNNILYFRIEPNSDYLLANLQARIETKLGLTSPEPQAYALDGAQANQASQQEASLEWSPLTKVANIRQERVEARLNMPREAEQLRITLCSRLNESLCGPEFSISMKLAASSFAQDQRGLSLSLLLSSLALIVLLGALATAGHSCCLARKGNKEAGLERADAAIDNKPNGGQQSHQAHQKGSHGSTTSTNSTSAGAQAAMQSLDSINGLAGASDHSSDHSRQAKLDSMLPPNYNHYADRATLMLEQQQQQQQQQLMQQQQALMSDMLSSPYGLPNGALLGAANQLPSPAMLAAGPTGSQFVYTQAQLEATGQQPMSLDQQALMEAGNPMQPPLFQQDEQAQLWPGADYSAGQYGYQQQQQQEQVMESPYGQTGGLMQAAAYDGQLSDQFHQPTAYLGAYNSPLEAQQYQQQQQYQQEMAAAQQQMYGTLSRTNFDQSSNGNSNSSNNNNSQSDSQQQYSATNGLVQPSHLPPVESDYGTTGARNGRLIREIIV